MEKFLSHRLSRIAAMVLAVSFTAACSEDGDPTGVTPDEVDPVETAAAMDDISASFDSSEGLQSYDALAPMMARYFGVNLLAVSTLPQMAGVPPTLRTVADQAVAFTVGGSPEVAGPVIPAEYFGITFVISPETGEYELSDRTGAPENGVRFILYAITPITGEPRLEDEVGHVDLRDTSDETANRLQTTVVIDGATLIDFESSCSFTQSSLDLSSAGFVGNGERTVDFDLSLSWSFTGGLEVDFSVEVVDENLMVVFTASVPDFLFAMAEGRAENDFFSTGNYDVSFRITHGTNSIGFVLTGSEGTISGEVEFCGGELGDDCAVVALISGTGDDITITDAGGNEIGPEGREALHRLFERAGEFVDRFFRYLGPAFALCFVAFG